LATLTHIVNSNEGLYDYTDVMKVGKLRVYFEKEGKEQVKLILDNVQYIPNFWVNLFSLMVAMSNSCTISNEGQAIIIEKNSLKLNLMTRSRHRMDLYAESSCKLSPQKMSHLWPLETKSAKT